MSVIYVDNISMSYPKAPKLYESILKQLANMDFKDNFDDYLGVTKKLIDETRELICKLINFDKSSNVIFTPNSSTSANMLIKTLFNKGDHIIVSSMESDYIMKPLNSLINKGVDISKVPFNSNGQLDTNVIPRLITPNTKAIILSHLSNVSGVILPLEQIGQICDMYNLLFIVDASQSLGVVDFNMNKINADAVIFSGNKYLLGPEGTGGFVIKDTLAYRLGSFIDGVNIYVKEKDSSLLPYRFEFGALNHLGLIGLNHSIKYILETKVNNINNKVLELTNLFKKELLNIDGVSILGDSCFENHCLLVSIIHKSLSPHEIDDYLKTNYKIYAKSGLHSNPAANKVLGTYPEGTLRFSFGYFNTIEDINFIIKALKNTIAKLDK